MKRILVVVIAVVIGLMAINANAQIPNVQVYFDYNLTETGANCPVAPPGTVLDSCYVVANNFNMWMNAIEYTIDYPPQILWVGDVFPTDRLTIGNSPSGVGVSWPLPGNAFGALVIQKIRFYWMCDNCDPQGPNADAPISVLPYPLQSTVRAVRWPDLAIVPGVGMTSLICATVPVEETTWGGIKSMYE
jgi:hypothetical protein